MKSIAFYIHSWFTWVQFCSISKLNQYNINNCQYTFIVSRGFKIPQPYLHYPCIRFEQIESLYLSHLDTSALYKHIKNTINMNSPSKYFDILFIPHLAYPPFSMLARQTIFNSVVFFQESLQLPSDVLLLRESEKLLTGLDSFYTSAIPELSSKLTYLYYYAVREILPLHLIGREVSIFKDEILSNIPLLSSCCYDFAFIAGKAQNSSLGVLFFDSIYHIYRHFLPSTRIMLKASPSSSQEIIKWMEEISQNDSLADYLDGGSAIESMIVANKIKVMFSEMFSLSGLLNQYSPYSTLISIDKTIVHDFPQYSSILTDRLSISSYKSLSFSFMSFSEYLISLHS